MNSSTIVGEIRPSEFDGAPPMKIIRRSPSAKYEITPPAEVRACEHNQFVLDEKWATVTCAVCNEKVDPFAVLMHFATWMEQFRRDQAVLKEQEKSTYIAELRRLKKLRAILPGEVAEIDDVIRHQYRTEPKVLRDLASRLDRDIRTRKRGVR